jgi:hypothetical protein
MKKTMFKGIMISLALTAVSFLVLEPTAGQTKDPLLFPKDNFTVETKTVKTSVGEKKVSYRLQYYLIPSANKYLKGLTDEKRNEYLANNKWITWSDKGATFAFADYVTHVGRMKGLPAFDDFDMRQPEPNLFGNKTTIHHKQSLATWQQVWRTGTRLLIPFCTGMQDMARIRIRKISLPGLADYVQNKCKLFCFNIASHQC